MEETKDIRWQQRFTNFERAFYALEKAVKVDSPSDLEKDGTIQRFEFTHELAWKVMKDYLVFQGIQGIIGSKEATKHSFNNGLIENGEVWMDMIESRNQTVHTYNQNILEVEYHKITAVYYAQIELFYQKMKTLL